MDFEHSHRFDQDEARGRLRALADYLVNKHGMRVEWSDADSAHLTGKYAVVSIDASVRIEGSKIRVTGKDPGMLWRAPAKKYIGSKLEKYLDPRETLETLPRS